MLKQNLLGSFFFLFLDLFCKSKNKQGLNLMFPARTERIRHHEIPTETRAFAPRNCERLMGALIDYNFHKSNLIRTRFKLISCNDIRTSTEAKKLELIKVANLQHSPCKIEGGLRGCHQGCRSGDSRGLGPFSTFCYCFLINTSLRTPLLFSFLKALHQQVSYYIQNL